MCTTTSADNMPEESGDDDVWAGSSDDGDRADGHPDRRELDREGAARHQQFYNAGYRDAIEEGKERTMQSGFNKGFREGAAAGFEWGLLRGATRTLAALDGQTAGTRGLHPQIQALAAASELPPRDAMLGIFRHLLLTAQQQQLASHTGASVAAEDGGAEGRGPHSDGAAAGSCEAAGNSERAAVVEAEAEAASALASLGLGPRDDAAPVDAPGRAAAGPAGPATPSQPLPAAGPQPSPVIRGERPGEDAGPIPLQHAVPPPPPQRSPPATGLLPADAHALALPDMPLVMAGLRRKLQEAGFDVGRAQLPGEAGAVAEGGPSGMRQAVEAAGGDAP